MRKIFLVFFISAIAVIGLFVILEKQTPVIEEQQGTVNSDSSIKITNENLKQVKEAQALVLADELYAETEILLDEMSSELLTEKFEANYDDVVEVDIELEQVKLPDLGFEIEEEDVSKN